MIWQCWMCPTLDKMAKLDFSFCALYFLKFFSSHFIGEYFTNKCLNFKYFNKLKFDKPIYLCNYHLSQYKDIFISPKSSLYPILVFLFIPHSPLVFVNFLGAVSSGCFPKVTSNSRMRPCLHLTKIPLFLSSSWGCQIK